MRIDAELRMRCVEAALRFVTTAHNDPAGAVVDIARKFENYVLEPTSDEKPPSERSSKGKPKKQDPLLASAPSDQTASKTPGKASEAVPPD